jgi:hypothetical protein
LLKPAKKAKVTSIAINNSSAANRTRAIARMMATKELLDATFPPEPEE